jgi:hypothetical protein
MSFIAVTRLRVRSVRFLPAFAMHFLRTRRQVRRAPRFRGGSVLPDRHWTFWTMTAWDSQENMRRYMTTPPHRTTMPYLLDCVMRRLWCIGISLKTLCRHGSRLISECARTDVPRRCGTRVPSMRP